MPRPRSALITSSLSTDGTYTTASQDQIINLPVQIDELNCAAGNHVPSNTDNNKDPKVLPAKKMASTKHMALVNSFMLGLCTSLMCSETDTARTAWNETHGENLLVLCTSLMYIKTNTDSKTWNETSNSLQKW